VDHDVRNELAQRLAFAGSMRLAIAPPARRASSRSAAAICSGLAGAEHDLGHARAQLAVVIDQRAAHACATSAYGRSLSRRAASSGDTAPVRT